jgi:acyl carrier protein
MNTLNKIKEIINIENIRIDSNIKDDLGLDSLDIVDKLLAIEDYYQIEIPDNKLEKIETIKDIVSCVDKLK